ncbi:MAG: hypothetical protein AAB821_01080, partial [Patescibacteria group bacterium]
MTEKVLSRVISISQIAFFPRQNIPGLKTKSGRNLGIAASRLGRARERRQFLVAIIEKHSKTSTVHISTHLLPSVGHGKFTFESEHLRISFMKK